MQFFNRRGGIYVTNSTAGIIGFPILFIGWLIFNKMSLNQILILFLIGFIFSCWALGNHFGFKQNGVNLYESRERIFNKALLAIQKKPFTGWGVANFDYAFNSVNWPTPLDNDIYVDKAHSTLLESITTTGLVGFTLDLFMYGYILIRLVRRQSEYQKYLLVTLLVFLWHSQTNITSISEDLIFWLVAALG